MFFYINEIKLKNECRKHFLLIFFNFYATLSFRVSLLQSGGFTDQMWSHIPFLSTCQSSTIFPHLSLSFFCIRFMLPTFFCSFFFRSCFFYLCCFSDLIQQTLLFLLFLLPIYLPALFPIILSHLLLLLGPVSGGEIWLFYCCFARSHLHREFTKPAYKCFWFKKKKRKK